MNQAAHETLLQALPVGVILLDQDGRVVLYNEAESRLSGLHREEVEGRLLAEVAPYADHQELTAGVCEALEASEVVDIELVRALRFEEEPELRITISVGVAAAPAATAA